MKKIRKVASPHVQIASQSHGLMELNIVAWRKYKDFSYAIREKVESLMAVHTKDTLSK